MPSPFCSNILLVKKFRQELQRTKMVLHLSQLLKQQRYAVAAHIAQTRYRSR